jgi:hypothetical protein
MATLSTIITPGNVLTATNTQTVTNKDLSSGTNTFPNFGDVVGPASSTDNAVARYDGTTGKLIQNSSVTVDDSGIVRALSVTTNNSNSGIAISGDSQAGVIYANNNKPMSFNVNGAQRLRITTDGAFAFGSDTAYGTSGQVLTSNGNATPTWTDAGNVVGPASATDNAIVRYDGTTGKLIQNSAVTIDDTDGLTARVVVASQSGSSVALYSSGSNTVHISTGNASTLLNFQINYVTRATLTPNGAWSFGSTGSAYGTSGQVLTSSGDAPPTWSTITAGDVDGPASSTDNAIARFDSTTGKLLQNSGITISDTGSLNLAGALDEKVFAVTGTTPAISPQNGTIQTWTLSGNSTPTAGTWSDGESITMMILDGTAFTITWTSVAVTWVGGSAPTLDTTKQNVVELWRVGGVIYGAFVGAA